MSREVNVLALVKGDEYFVYVYDDASRAALDAQLKGHAADPGLALSFFDAAVLCKKADEQAKARARI